MTITNILLILVIITIFAMIIMYYIKSKQNAEVQETTVDDQTYTLDTMIEYVKRRLEEKIRNMS